MNPLPILSQTAARTFRHVALWLALAVITAPSAATAAPTALDGRLRVSNDRTVPVMVQVDGEPRGAVLPGRVGVFRNVPNGTRLVTFSGAGVAPFSMEVSVPVRGLGVCALAPVRGALRLKNDSGLTMAVRLDGRRLGRVRAGDMLAADGLAPGRYRLFARPVGKMYREAAGIERVVFVQPGRTTRTQLGPWFSALEVKNPYASTVRVYLDGSELGPLRAGATLLLRHQIPGTHTLALRSGGRVVARDTLEFAAGERLRWAPRRQPGHVRVTNTTGSRLTMRLGDDRLAVLAPGEMRTFHGLRPGAHRVTVQGADGRRRMQTIEVAANGTARVAISGPTAAPGILF